MSVPPPGENQGAEHRAMLYQAVQRWPGLHLADLARRAGLSDALARYHVRLLVKSGLLAESGPPGLASYFPVYAPHGLIDRRDRDAVALLRRPVPLQLTLVLLAADQGLVMSDLAAAADIAPATATYHVQRMRAAALVDVQAEGRHHRVTLLDAGRVRGLLLSNPPPVDIVQGFVDLWDRLEL